MLTNKKILLGVTGGIAAYKAAYLVRLLVKQGAEVRVVMTPDALEFITPLTLATLSRNEVYHRFANPDTGAWYNHVDLGLWADVMVIAPATANTIGAMVSGQANNLLLATYLSARCPVFVAPAMDLDMYRHPATLRNLQALANDGVMLIDAEEGELASGLYGQGRMAEPEHIVKALETFFSQGLLLKGEKVLVTAGPTYEYIDPVRFVGNFSSGKMGFALAEAFAALGAEVTLVTGPTHLKAQHVAIHTVPVVSAVEMLDACQEKFADAYITVMAAAVADYTPAHMAGQKIKKQETSWQLELTRTTDILASLGQHKQPGQVLVGFALETENELQHAQEKLARKNLDMIVLNSLNDAGAGFGHDTNQVTLISKSGDIRRLELMSKTEVAKQIVEYILALRHA